MNILDLDDLLILIFTIIYILILVLIYFVNR